MKAKSNLVYGVGINDATYVTKPMVNGKQKPCPFFRRWENMLRRCYSPKCQLKQPTYIGCSVTMDWLKFSNFKSWMEKQDWDGRHLDKDILVFGNKVYSPETCVFVDRVINNFTIDSSASRGKWPIGVHFCMEKKKFIAHCHNPFTKKTGYVGKFDCPNEAHEAWRRRKHELACQLAELQSDSRVAHALRNRYANPL